MKGTDSNKPKSPDAPRGLLASLLLKAEAEEGGLAAIAERTADKYRMDLSDAVAPPSSEETPITSYVSYGRRDDPETEEE